MLDSRRLICLTVILMTAAERQSEQAGFEAGSPEPGCLRIALRGDWRIEADIPPAAPLISQLAPESGIRRVVFDCTALGTWDSSLLVFLLQVRDSCDSAEIAFVADALPPGAARLLALARAVPEQTDRTAKGDEGLVARIGINVVERLSSGVYLLRFVGEGGLSFGRLLGGRARFRRRDFGLMMQACGTDALPIVSVISLLVGTIVAFLGAIQLQAFGVQIFVADMVAIGMFREMGALMTGVIMAGRTGAAFAAQLGTMQVNEEVDALKTMGISPVDFLVLPRVLALLLVMPLLTMYSNVLGVLGGLLVGIGTLDLSAIAFYTEAAKALSLDDLAVGLIKSVIFGALIALAGCRSGMRCGRSASAVGEATTEAVVSAIVYIIIADSIVAVVTTLTGF